MFVVCCLVTCSMELALMRRRLTTFCLPAAAAAAAAWTELPWMSMTTMTEARNVKIAEVTSTLILTAVADLKRHVKDKQQLLDHFNHINFLL